MIFMVPLCRKCVNQFFFFFIVYHNCISFPQSLLPLKKNNREMGAGSRCMFFWVFSACLCLLLCLLLVSCFFLVTACHVAVSNLPPHPSQALSVPGSSAPPSSVALLAHLTCRTTHAYTAKNSPAAVCPTKTVRVLDRRAPSLTCTG